MREETYISLRDFCRGHSLDEGFVFELQEVELVRIVEAGEGPAIPESDLHRLERLVRLHRDLEISPQGLQAVQHLLERLEAMQEELLYLRRKLGRLE